MLKIVNDVKFNINDLQEGKKLLCMNEKFKVVSFVFEEGKGLPNHKHNGYASIYVCDGLVDFEFKDGEKYELTRGDFMPFDARIEHNVIAREKSKVMVTISAPLT